MSAKEIKPWQRLLFGETLIEKNKSHQIAYVAVLTALNVVVNAVASIPLGFVQFSFTIFISMLTGIMIGPLFGFGACFLGDTLGYLIGNGGGNGWTPWIGLATAMMALITGFLMYRSYWKVRWAWIVKLTFACVLTFLISTVAINTTAMYLMWYKDTYDSWMRFFLVRFFLQGQIWNSLINYVLLFAALPIFERIKSLNVKIR